MAAPRPNSYAQAYPRRRQLDVRLLIASGAIEAEVVPSLWRSLLAWLLGPSPFYSPLADHAAAAVAAVSTQFPDTTQVLP